MLLILFNPLINKSEKTLYNDILILVSDKSQSVVEANKLKQLIEAREKIKTVLMI